MPPRMCASRARFKIFQYILYFSKCHIFYIILCFIIFVLLNYLHRIVKFFEQIWPLPFPRRLSRSDRHRDRPAWTSRARFSLRSFRSPAPVSTHPVRSYGCPPNRPNRRSKTSVRMIDDPCRIAIPRFQDRSATSRNSPLRMRTSRTLRRRWCFLFHPDETSLGDRRRDVFQSTWSARADFITSARGTIDVRMKSSFA